MGRGSSGATSSGGGRNSAFSKNAKPQKFETFARRGGLNDHGYEAKISGDDPSVLTLGKANYEYDYANATRTTTPVTFEVTHGFYQSGNARHDTYDYGINWSNVSEVKGETFAVKDKLKELGFKWDRGSSSWKKQRR